MEQQEYTIQTFDCSIIGNGTKTRKKFSFGHSKTNQSTKIIGTKGTQKRIQYCFGQPAKSTSRRRWDWILNEDGSVATVEPATTRRKLGDTVKKNTVHTIAESSGLAIGERSIGIGRIDTKGGSVDAKCKQEHPNGGKNEQGMVFVDSVDDDDDDENEKLDECMVQNEGRAKRKAAPKIFFVDSDDDDDDDDDENKKLDELSKKDPDRKRSRKAGDSDSDYDEDSHDESDLDDDELSDEDVYVVKSTKSGKRKKQKQQQQQQQQPPSSDYLPTREECRKLANQVLGRKKSKKKGSPEEASQEIDRLFQRTIDIFHLGPSKADKNMAQLVARAKEKHGPEELLELLERKKCEICLNRLGMYFVGSAYGTKGGYIYAVCSHCRKNIGIGEHWTTVMAASCFPIDSFRYRLEQSGVTMDRGYKNWSHNIRNDALTEYLYNHYGGVCPMHLAFADREVWKKMRKYTWKSEFPNLWLSGDSGCVIS